MRINTNISALNAHRQLGANQANAAKAMERLSSGLRINRAGDDAAGLAISEKMRGQVRGLKQASRNSQDGISLIQTAEGALNETHAILQRMRELAVQSATDTNEAQDRDEIQKEINQLTSEINRIGNTTEFNKKTLLNGELVSNYEKTPAVYGDNTTAEVTKAVTQTIEIGVDAIKWDDNSNAEFGIAFSGTADNGFDWGNIDTEENNELVITKSGDDFTISFAGQDDDGKTLEINADLVSFDAATSTYSYNNQGISFSFTTEDVAGWAEGESVTFNLSGLGAADVTGSHQTIGGKVELGVAGTYTTPLIGDFTMSSVTVNGDKALQTVDKMEIAWDEASETFTVELSDKDGVVSTTTFSLTAGETLNFNADGISFNFTAPGVSDDKDATITGTFEFKTETAEVTVPGEVVTPAEVVDQSLAFQIGANENQAMTLEINDMRAGALGLTGSGTGYTESMNVTDGTNNTVAEKALDVSNAKDAASAITRIDDAIKQVSSERSKLGASQNRLEHTIANLGTSAENLQAAESRIRDLDMAEEIMNFTKNNILQQAATAMLAQANMAPQSVLQLLG